MENKNKPTVFEKLQIKIKSDTGLDVSNFKRTYASIHKKSSGGFVWVAQLGCMSCGSAVTATELLKQDKIELIENPSLGAQPEFI